MRNAKVWRLSLESYRERYTELLSDWTRAPLEAAGYEVVELSRETRGEISTGRVLDAHLRVRHALAQSAEAARLSESMTADDVVWLDDLYTPGVDGLLYALSSTRPRGSWPRLVARNFAQSVDKHDFTYEWSWMRAYERMIMQSFDLVVCASDIHAELIRAAHPGGARVENTGLPFDADRVRGVAGERTNEWTERPAAVAFGSRLDVEKNPMLMLATARELKRRGVQVHVSTGSQHPRSNGGEPVLSALRDAESKGDVVVHAGSSKSDWYRLLNRCRVLLLTSDQDWVSYCLLEADAMGCNVVAPSYRTFPEVVPSRRLYARGDAAAAAAAVLDAMHAPDPWVGAQSRYHSSSVARTLSSLLEGGRS